MSRQFAPFVSETAHSCAQKFASGLSQREKLTQVLIATSNVSSRLESVRTILSLRWARRSYFQPELFGEPAWDILLELYAAHLSNRSECVSSLCIASGVPATTALRRLVSLELNGWIKRRPDPLDDRRTHMRLSGKSLQAFDRFFEC